MIIEVLGNPAFDLMCKGKRSYIFFDKTGKKKEFKEAKNRKPGSKSLRNLLETGDTEFIDFIEV
jgi:hypothetical protein